jgi:hypothetical protein
MKSKIKVILVAGSICLLSACAGLPERSHEAAADTDLILIHQDKSVRLYARPDFDPSRFSEFSLNHVDVQTASSLDAKQKAEQERLGTDLEAQITKLLTEQHAAMRLRMDIHLSEIEPVSPALNVATIVLAFVPLDTGAMTVETTYRDDAGKVQVRRIERLTGSIFNIRASFSAYGQHKITLDEWAQRCVMSVACLSRPVTSAQ